MSDRRLIVGEFDETDGSVGKLFALSPNNATAVGIPAFRYGTVRPVVGGVTGEAFIDSRTGVASVWNGNTWTDIARPVITHQPDDATLLADAPNDGVVAMSEASGNVFTRVNGNWLALGLRVFATQAAMTAATPANGSIGYAEDTGAFSVYTNNAWAAVNNQGVFVGAQAPANPLTGQQWYEAATHTLWTWDGANWQPPSGGLPIGTIITHVSTTAPAGFLLCDGSPIPGATGYDALRNMIGADTPDLTDQFIRGADNQNQIDGFTKHQYTTARPRNDFRVTADGQTSNGGGHHHTFNSHMYNTDGGWSSSNPEIWTNTIGSRWSHRTDGEEGIHHHTVTVDGRVYGGGDTETAPAHVRLAYHIKAL